MIRDPGRPRHLFVLPLLALALAAGAGSLSAPTAQAQETPKQFWHIPVWAMPGAWQDSTLQYPARCPGTFQGPRPDSLQDRPRTVTVRFLRSRRVEALPRFGGYRIFRITGTPDTANAVLLRRYSVNVGDELLWHWSRVDTTNGGTSPVLKYPEGDLVCPLAAAYDSVLTFVDPDSSGQYEKRCRREDHLGRCLSIGDSVWKLVAPPGPHDGFRTWYTVTYESYNTIDNNYEDLFVPDTSDWSKCGTPGVAASCPNLNNKLANMIAQPVEPTGGPTANLQAVAVVPNPFRADEAWDRPGGNEIHFINLPDNARIRVYTVAGDLVRELHHTDTVRDFERWDLKNSDGRDVASGIYMYRVEAGSFFAQNRFIVIR